MRKEGHPAPAHWGSELEAAGLSEGSGHRDPSCGRAPAGTHRRPYYCCGYKDKAAPAPDRASSPKGTESAGENSTVGQELAGGEARDDGGAKRPAVWAALVLVSTEAGTRGAFAVARRSHAKAAVREDAVCVGRLSWEGDPGAEDRRHPE